MHGVGKGEGERKRGGKGGGGERKGKEGRGERLGNSQPARLCAGWLSQGRKPEAATPQGHPHTTAQPKQTRPAHPGHPPKSGTQLARRRAPCCPTHTPHQQLPGPAFPTRTAPYPAACAHRVALPASQPVPAKPEHETDPTTSPFWPTSNASPGQLCSGATTQPHHLPFEWQVPPHIVSSHTRN